MALPLVTAAVSLFYLGAIPVCFAFHWRSSTGLGYGISVFEGRFARKQALRPRPMKPSKPKPKPRISDVLPALKYLLKHLEFFRLGGTLGTGDAAATALLCGSVQSVGYALEGVSNRHIHIALIPDFYADCIQADLSGMISLRAGHIMLAALLGVYEYASGRISQWISTPSKVL